MEKSLVSLACKVVKLNDPTFHSILLQIANDLRYMSFFKDCIEAIDGTHVDVRLSDAEKVAYIGRLKVLQRLINVLLGLFEKLSVVIKKLKATGILLNVEKLCGHKTTDIKVRAQALLARWNAERINDDDYKDMEKGCLNLVESSKPSTDATSAEVKHGEDKNFDSPPCQKAVEEGSCVIDSGRNERLQARSPNNLQSNTTDDGLKVAMPHQTMKLFTLSEKKEKSALFPTPSLDSNSFDEKLSADESSVAVVVMPPSSTPVFPKALINDHDECFTSATEIHDGICTKMNTGLGVSYDSSQSDGLCVLPSTGQAVTSPTKRPILACTTSAILDSLDGRFNLLEPVDTSLKSIGADKGTSKNSRTLEFKSEGDSDKEVENLYDNGSPLREEANGIASEDNLLLNESILKECRGTDELLFGDPSIISKFKVTKALNKKSDLDLESGEFDALEVARQVAIEVEREVDYREQSCSSSSYMSSGDIICTAIPDIAQNKQDHPVSGKINEKGSMSGNVDSDSVSSPKNDNCKYLEVTTDDRKAKQSLQSPDQAAAHQKTSNPTQKFKYDFDLNVDVFSENFDCAMNSIPSNPVNLSAPTTVSGSNGAPVWAAPLQFGGAPFWRGSADMSAFRSASLQMALDPGKTKSDSKQKENLIEIDLNVLEIESNVALDPAVLKELPASYCVPSRDSSVEVSSEWAARIQLDLSSIGDEEAQSLQSSLLSHHPRKISMSLSSTLSTSSRKPSMNNFDLNDNLFLLDDFSSQNLNTMNSSVLPIMGSKKSVEKTDDANEVYQTYVGSGLTYDAFMIGRPMMPYVHQVPPIYSYNEPGVAPAFPFHPSIYGNSNIPLMAEARSSTVMSQLMRSAGPHGAPLPNHPFLMSIANTPSSLNGVEPSNLGMDLNSGLFQTDSGNREARSLNHFFMPGHSNLLEEQMKTSSQHSTSVLPLKRKEPDSGWDPYGFGYNQMTSWH
ncbi:uncharacterized protein LOC110032344 [Phalaenopsis equestris]|uniref:uncharacterized protein LOC110032344 n=1 Tax=Phalaenopsis equestris TaxID=78828 RepID=UPI0009E1B597|nr:uncharacterized protein LOC110032344 [Phalaenopsis equestris]